MKKPQQTNRYVSASGQLLFRANWWLRDVVSSAYFANVNNNGDANYNNASNVNGVRPDFKSTDKTQMRAGV